MKLIRSFLIGVAFLVLFTCSSDDSGEPFVSGPANTNTNKFIISGSPIGANTATVDQLRKNITFSLENSHSDFEIGPAYAVREGADVTILYWVVGITNISNTVHCFINLSGGKYLSSDNTELETGLDEYVFGSMRKFLTGDYSNSCLAPGQRGDFFNGSVTTTFDQIGGIVFNSIKTFTGETQVSDLALEVTSYSVSIPDNLQQVIRLEVTNGGVKPVIIQQTSYSILLNDDNSPLIWDFFDRPSSWSGGLSQGQAGTLEMRPAYAGGSQKLIIYLEVQAPLTSQSQIVSRSNQPILNENDFSTHEDYFLYRLNVRTQNERLKRLRQ